MELVNRDVCVKCGGSFPQHQIRIGVRVLCLYCYGDELLAALAQMRCRTCAHWSTAPYQAPACTRPREGSTARPEAAGCQFDHETWLETDAEHGCVMWTSKKP